MSCAEDNCGDADECRSASLKRERREGKLMGNKSPEDIMGFEVKPHSKPPQRPVYSEDMVESLKIQEDPKVLHHIEMKKRKFHLNLALGH